MSTSEHPYVEDDGLFCGECGLPKGHPRHPQPEPLPETPYAGTSGWSGSQTSRERAETEDRGGVTSQRQEQVLAGLGMVGTRGLTWKELAGSQGWHHGQASGALSTLHKTGHIARLTERRDRCQVYVLPEHVNGRETAEQGRAAADPDVVKREQFRVVGMTYPSGQRDSEPLSEREHADRVVRYHGGRVQRRTVIETPWEDA